MELNDLKCIVTGGGGGMGAYFATQLAEAGASVAVGDINEAGLADLPASVHTRRLDVSDEADCEAFVAWASEQMGGVNALINNAGIIRDGLLVRKSRRTGEVSKLPTAMWDSVIAVNLTGATLMVRETVAAMLEQQQRPGVIVNISSISRFGNRGQSNYTAAKAALAANTVTWAREFAPHGIRVAAVAPGFISTPMTAGMNQKALDAASASILVGRIGEPRDIWKAVKFAFECDYLNGTTVDVHGGM